MPYHKAGTTINFVRWLSPRVPEIASTKLSNKHLDVFSQYIRSPASACPTLPDVASNPVHTDQQVVIHTASPELLLYSIGNDC